MRTGADLCHHLAMLFADGALGLILLGLWIFCLIDVITTDQSQMRNLPKMAWVLIVLLLADIGSILWLVAGREWQTTGQSRANRGAGGAFPEYDRPGRAVPANPDDDEQFLRNVRERAEQQRRRYEAQRQAELEAEQARLLKKPEDD
jgi:phospholipase D-like protein